MTSEDRPRFWRRLFLALVKTLLWGVLLIVLIVGGFLVTRELRRSFDNVTSRVDVNKEDLQSLRSEVSALMADAPTKGRQIEELRAEADELEGRLRVLQDELTGDLDRQQELLTAMEAELATAMDNSDTAIARTETAVEDATTFGTALSALQGDLNDLNGRIDALGGEVDSVRAETDQIMSSVGEFGESVDSAKATSAEVSSLQETITLFHTWELVARARLRLLEDNVGLATADVERAFRAIDALADEVGDESGALRVLQTRLAFALTNLPDNPSLAASDLENAWDELDVILTSRILPDMPAELETESFVPTVAPATPTPAAEQATPEPTATSSP